MRVHTGAGDFEADACIVTVPLGVLKRPNNLRFLPPLPPRKQEAIQRLGFGCLNKVMLLFPHCFWGDKVCVWGGGCLCRERGLGGSVKNRTVDNGATVAGQTRKE